MKRIVMLVVLGALLLAACGIPKQNDREAARPTTGGAQTVGIDATNDAFRPRTVQAQPGRPLVVEVHNKGWTKHTFTIDGTNVNVSVPAGHTERIMVPAPGSDARVRFRCRFHDANGMHGVIVFGSPGPALSQ
jgi:plastocyanin